jgi:hypothetical protein
VSEVELSAGDCDCGASSDALGAIVTSLEFNGWMAGGGSATVGISVALVSAVDEAGAGTDAFWPGTL